MYPTSGQVVGAINALMPLAPGCRRLEQMGSVASVHMPVDGTYNVPLSAQSAWLAWSVSADVVDALSTASLELTRDASAARADVVDVLSTASWELTRDASAARALAADEDVVAICCIEEDKPATQVEETLAMDEKSAVAVDCSVCVSVPLMDARADEVETERDATVVLRDRLCAATAEESCVV